MSRRLPASAAIEAYVNAHSRESAAARALRAETAQLAQAGMQIGADQAALLGLLVRMLGARHCLEIGTFTGMSALAVASALPADGRLVCCDVSEAWTAIARRHWQQAGVAQRIELRLAPALETLRALRDTGGPPFDLAFIDADKANYGAYYEACLELLRPGGVVALDNMLWSGRVADPACRDADTDALRALNARIHADARVDACLLTVGDGVLLACKRG